MQHNIRFSYTKNTKRTSKEILQLFASLPPIWTNVEEAKSQPMTVYTPDPFKSSKAFYSV